MRQRRGHLGFVERWVQRYLAAESVSTSSSSSSSRWDYKNGAELEQREGGQDVFDAIPQRDSHPVALAHSLSGQAVGECRRQGVQAVVAELLVLVARHDPAPRTINQHRTARVCRARWQEQRRSSIAMFTHNLGEMAAHSLLKQRRLSAR